MSVTVFVCNRGKKPDPKRLRRYRCLQCKKYFTTSPEYEQHFRCSDCKKPIRRKYDGNDDTE